MYCWKKASHWIVNGGGEFICSLLVRDKQVYTAAISLKFLWAYGRSHQTFDQISRFPDEITMRNNNYECQSKQYLSILWCAHPDRVFCHMTELAHSCWLNGHVVIWQNPATVNMFLFDLGLNTMCYFSIGHTVLVLCPTIHQCSKNHPPF